MGRLPAEVRAMTPAETVLMIDAWNKAQGGDGVAPPTRDELDTLMEKYPDVA